MPLVTRPGGLLFVAYSSDGTTWLKVDGTPTNPQNLSPTPIKNTLTNGEYQSGQSLNPSVEFFDWTDYSALETLAVGASRDSRYWAFQYESGYWKTSSLAYPMVNPMMKANRGDGDNTWKLEIKLDVSIALTYTAGTLTTS